MFDKAYRWVAEMEEIAGFLRGQAGSGIYTGAAGLYQAIAADRDGNGDGDSDDAVARLAAFYARK
jgi:hypothetical protein